MKKRFFAFIVLLGIIAFCIALYVDDNLKNIVLGFIETTILGRKAEAILLWQKVLRRFAIIGICASLILTGLITLSFFSIGQKIYKTYFGILSENKQFFFISILFILIFSFGSIVSIKLISAKLLYCVTPFCLIVLPFFIAGTKGHTKEIFWILFLSVMCYFFMESTSNPYGTYLIAPNVFIANVLLYFLIYAFLYFLIGSKAISLLTIFICIIGFVNCFLMQARGRALTFGDFSSFRTALNVAKKYEISKKDLICFSLMSIGFIGTSILSFLDSLKSKNKNILLKKRLALSLCAVLAFFIASNKLFLGTMHIRVGYWSSEHTGFFANLLLELQNFSLKKSENYSTEEIERLLNGYKETVDKQDVNIIVVMNESFSDLSVLGDFETNTGYLDFYNSLEKNCIKGNAYVSGEGGGTANSEYEFLTGDSMLFYPSNSTAYVMGCIKKNTETLASFMKEAGYTTLAFHPWNRSGYERAFVYPLFGFEKMRFIEDMEVSPDDRLRNLPSDLFDYKELFSLYDNEENSHKFIFNITIQNHGGYNSRSMENTVRLTKNEGAFPEVEQYLSLIKESDSSLEFLISSINQRPEKIILCLFGDHQPPINSGFIEEKSDNEKDPLKRHITPFLIYANFDIQEGYVEKISLNYLCAFMFQTAGLPLAPYQKYLLKLREEFPVITAKGAIDKNGRFYSRDEALEHPLISQYMDIIYNHIVEKKEQANFFKIP